MIENEPASAETHTPLGDILGSRGAPQDPPAGSTSPASAPAPQPAPRAETAPAAPEAPAAVPPAAAAPAQPAAHPEGPYWYRKDIQAARRRADDAERRAQELEQRLQHNRPAPAQRQEEEGEPDPYQQYVEARIAQERLVMRLENSQDRFVEKHTEDVFEDVKTWLIGKADPRTGANPMEQWAMQQRDPWAAAFDQFRREGLAAEIGDDPASWREKEREKLRQELLAEMGGGAPAPAPAPSMAAAPSRPNPPPPASQARAAAPRDPQTGQYAPAGALTKHSFR